MEEEEDEVAGDTGSDANVDTDREGGSTPELPEIEPVALEKEVDRVSFLDVK